MNDIIFKGSASINIEGFNPLMFIQQERDCAIYEPTGFDGAVAVIDFRPNNAPVDAPADVTVSLTETAVLQFTLRPTKAKKPKHMLWLATGTQNTAPPEAPLFMQIAPLQDDQFSYLALCRAQKHKRRM